MVSPSASVGSRPLTPHRALDAAIDILIVDDHPLLREGLIAVIQGEPGMRVVAEASDGNQAIAFFRKYRPNVTVMDLQMPNLDGVAATTAIRSEWPDARILMLSTYRGDVQALRALKAGACGYLLKSMVRLNLLEAIRSVNLGLRYIPQEIAAELAAHVTDESLSSREVDVLRRVAAGSSNKIIAAQIYVSEETVKSHLKNIMAKLGAKDRTHAVTIALKRGIIEM